ncbi:MAG: hypothetical protein Q4G00_01360 [Clostridia bacterium]|nr:hypothetical protein [Clostridia bacterium]
MPRCFISFMPPVLYAFTGLFISNISYKNWLAVSMRISGFFLVSRAERPRPGGGQRRKSARRLQIFKSICFFCMRQNVMYAWRSAKQKKAGPMNLAEQRAAKAYALLSPFAGFQLIFCSGEQSCNQERHRIKASKPMILPFGRIFGLLFTKFPL